MEIVENTSLRHKFEICGEINKFSLALGGTQ